MAIRKLLVLVGKLRGELPAGDTISCLPLEPIPRAKLPPAATSRGLVYLITDAPVVGMTLTWSDGTSWQRPSGLATVSLL